MGPLRIAQWNCRGLRARTLKLANWLAVEKPFLMLLNETRMEECKFKNYRSFSVRSDDAWGVGAEMRFCPGRLGNLTCDNGCIFEALLWDKSLLQSSKSGGFFPLFVSSTYIESAHTLGVSQQPEEEFSQCKSFT